MGISNIEQGILNYEIFSLQNSEFCIRYSIFTASTYGMGAGEGIKGGKVKQDDPFDR
jgi:hypothetical protein